jgi:hypothetical protein
LEGWLDAEHGTQVRALIEQLATRRPTTTDGVADTRTIPERQAIVSPGRQVTTPCDEFWHGTPSVHGYRAHSTGTRWKHEVLLQRSRRGG